ncbi:MAG: hypothetical protein ACRC6E_10600 [Fusobacteriaceae bacterium]
MSITHIFNKDLQKLVSLNYELEEFKAQPTLCYPEWTNDMHATERDFNHPKLDQSNTIVEKTRIELVEEGIEPLNDGEILRFTMQPLEEGSEPVQTEEKEIVYIPCPVEMFKPKWETPEWVESATLEELEEKAFNESIEFYNEELTFASKATAELQCEIISEEMFLSVKEYMQAIDPYAVNTLEVKAVVSRPSIFDRYN